MKEEDSPTSKIFLSASRSRRHNNTDDESPSQLSTTKVVATRDFYFKVPVQQQSNFASTPALQPTSDTTRRSRSRTKNPRHFALTIRRKQRTKNNSLMMMDQTTFLLSLARFMSAIARLSLGPLLPLLTLSLKFPESAKPALLSAFSSGYIMTQIGGGYLADRYGFGRILTASTGISAIILAYLSLSTGGFGASSTSTTSVSALWTQAYFVLGIVAGPLFPAGSAAIACNVPKNKRAASMAIVDAAASAGTTVASLTPLIASQLFKGNWNLVFQLTAVGLALVAATVSTTSFPSSSSSSSSSHQSSTTTKLSTTSTSSTEKDSMTQVNNNSINNNDKNNGVTHHNGNHNNKKDTTTKAANNKESTTGSSTSSTTSALIHPLHLLTYVCHSVDNFSKYSINSWAATMLASQHQASPAMIGTILGAQEGIGVLSKVLVGILLGGKLASTNLQGIASAVGFVCQGMCLWMAFGANTAQKAGIWLVLSAIAVGSHSIGFRPIYVQAGNHSGAVSGFGNTIASFASVLGPLTIGTAVVQQGNGIIKQDWPMVAMWMLVVNLVGSAAGFGIAILAKTKKE